MANSLNLSVDQGTTFARVLTLKDGSNVAIDLTGYTFRGQARAKFSDTNAAFSFTFSLRDQTSETGKVDMKILPASTASLSIIEETTYHYDVEMISGGGDITRIFEGSLTLRPEVTK